MRLLTAKEEDIVIVDSPTGFPGRALRNKFTKTIDPNVDAKISHCYNCMIPCNPSHTIYCISEALIIAAKGDVENGLVFAGENAYRVNKKGKRKKELIDELMKELNDSLD